MCRYPTNVASVHTWRWVVLTLEQVLKIVKGNLEQSKFLTTTTAVGVALAVPTLVGQVVQASKKNLPPPPPSVKG